MPIQQEQARSDQQAQGNVNIQSRMVFHGPVFVLFAPITVVGLFIFGVFAFTHFKQLVAMSGTIVAWSLFLLAAAAIIGLAWCASKVLLMLAYGCVELYRHFAETRIAVQRDKKVLAIHPNYAILMIDGQPELKAVPQEKHTYTHRQGRIDEIEEVDEDEPPALPSPQLPSHVEYDAIRRQVPPGRSLVGVSERGVETRDRSIRALVWVVGGSGTGKTNSVSIRVDEDYERGAWFLVIDPHAFKEDSLYNAIKGYASRFLLPMAQDTADIIAVLDFFLEEFARRKAGEKWEHPITILVDETGSLTSYIETEEEEELVRKLKEVARICGQESRGFDMCGVFISQDAAGLAWLRKRAIMVLAHQVTMWSERILVCNNDSKIARSMDNWPKGRTLVYGLAFQEGPRVLQQPLFHIRTVDADASYTPYMEPLQRPPVQTEETDEPGQAELSGDVLRVYEACQQLQKQSQRISSRNVEALTGIDKDRANNLMNKLADMGYMEDRKKSTV